MFENQLIIVAKLKNQFDICIVKRESKNKNC